jgi:sialate O-acetylesterase
MQKQLLLTIAIIAFLTACTNDPSSTSADIQLHPFFTDGMVLQQTSEVSIWGSAQTNREISIEASWEATVQTTSDAEGKWSALLPTPEAGGPHAIKIISGRDTLQITDVLIGEVWLASGQSNMEMPLKGWPPNDPILNSAQEIAQADYPQIRMFTVRRNFSATPLTEINGQWLSTNPENAGDFSATAYFFAERLHNNLQVPVGIIHSSWGGTPAEAWTSEEKLRSLGDFNQELDAINDPAMQKAIDGWFGPLQTIPMPNSEAEWQTIDLQDAAFIEGSVTDEVYQSIELPGAIDQAASGSYDGVVWLKKTIQIEDPGQTYTLQLGAIDDMDATYVNGQKIGGYEVPGFYNTERSYKIPTGLLQTGDNTIAIRVIDTGGGGSISGPMALKTADGSAISLEGDWKLRTTAEIKGGKFYLYPEDKELAQRPNIQELDQNTPSALYNAMIHPLIPYQIAGAIWYQGESNVGRAEQYQKLFPAMITDWRERWGKDFPFYFVQIAPYNYGNNLSPALRDAQRLSLKTPNTGMVVTLDIGNPQNIHPANKQDVGRRLAGLALENQYGQDLLSSGPLPQTVTFEGGMAKITFQHTGSGLLAKEGSLTGFELAGTDKAFVSAVAKIVGKTVEVYSPGLTDPAYVRYAYQDISTASLFNREGLPASSFSSENME